MKIAVVGTGYVGLVTGTCFAEVGHEVACIDVDEEKVTKMRSGIIPIYEPGLEDIFKRCIENKRLRFTTSLEDGINGAEAIFLALPTPPNDDGSADLSYVLNVADKLGSIINKYVVVVDKSTVPVGTAEKVRDRISANSKVEFDVISNPEFLREGFAVNDFLNPDRIVIGTNSASARAVAEDLYKPFTQNGSPLIFMDERSAEMTKYAANSFLATKISFMNEIANLCELTGADVDAVRIGIGADERIGKRFLYPGIGYGGSCFPKDVKALTHTAEENGYNFEILSAVSKVNELQKTRLADKVLAHFGMDITGMTFALWGLSFKPDTDDIREAPSLEIIDKLIAGGAKVVAYDPEASENVKKYHPNKDLTFAETPYEALTQSDALLIATEWPVFTTADFDIIKKELKNPVIFDGRNIYKPAEVRESGITYYSIGRH